MRRSEQNSLEAFALRIERRLLKAGDTSTLENLVCRHLTNKKNPVTAARMLEKVVEWKYGKAKETISLSGTVTHEHRTITEQLTDDELAAVENLIESANARGNQE